MFKSVDETEDKIKIAAREVFLEKGKDGARMQEIAERAGVNKALVHYYFRSKEKLYLAVLKDGLKEIINRLTAIPENIPFQEFLRQFISDHIDFLNRNRKLLNFILWELREERQTIHNFIKDVISSFETQPGNELLRRIQQAVRNKEIKPVNPLHLLINMVSLDIFPFVASPIITMIFELSEQDLAKLLEERKQEVFHLLWNYIKPENV